MTKLDRTKRYEDYNDFFELNGNYIMKVSSLAAINICRECTNRKVYIWRIEGGIWHNPGFEARIDCIWDSNCNPDKNMIISLKENNQLAESFIKEEMDIHDTFIITIRTI